MIIKYELVKIENKWELYFLDKEFMAYVFIREYNNDTKVLNIQKDILDIWSKKGYIVQLKYNI